MNTLLQSAWKRTGPWILYDADCPLCRRSVARFGPLLRRHGFRLAPLQSPVGKFFAPGPLREMKLVTRGGQVFGGAHALACIAADFWWATPLAWSWRIAPLRRLYEKWYRHVAAHRHCDAASCGITQSINPSATRSHP